MLRIIQYTAIAVAVVLVAVVFGLFIGGHFSNNHIRDTEAQAMKTPNMKPMIFLCPRALKMLLPAILFG
jgi:hypothetical protein